MRVLTVVYRMDPGGGIETFLMDFFRAVDQSGLDLEVCCTSGEPGGLSAELNALGVQTWCCRQGRNAVSFTRRFRRELKRRGPYDVLHAHTGHYAGPALVAARRWGVPIRLAHYHNVHPGHKGDWSRRLYDRWMKRLVCRAATGIVGCSWASLAAYFPDHWRRDSRMQVIRLGIRTESFPEMGARAEVRRELGIPVDALLVGHIGRFTPVKNHAGLIQAARVVSDRRSDVYFALVGDGVLRPAIGKQVRQSGLDDKVKFTGLRRDIPRLLSAMDISVLPSFAEGFPLSLIEAQCAGLPIVASDILSSREAVAPWFHKYLRAPNDISGLADAILAALHDVVRDPFMRQRARDFGGQFTIDMSVRAMLAAWGYPGVVAPSDPCASSAQWIRASSTDEIGIAETLVEASGDRSEPFVASAGHGAESSSGRA